jgi:hypothetical protein
LNGLKIQSNIIIYKAKSILISGPIFDQIYEFSIFKKIDQDLLKERINRINFLVDQDYMLENPNYIFSKICSDLNSRKFGGGRR